MIETRLLHYFLAIAREQSITRAADVLHISQPTLSKQMMDLEAQLGKTLLIRGRKIVTLTEDGTYLRTRAQEIIDLMEQTETALLSDSKMISGDVHLGCGETLAMERITRIFKRIHDEYPQVHFHLYSGAADSVLSRLDKGLLDVGLLISPIQQEKYDYMPLGFKDHFGLLMPSNDPLTSQEMISMQTLSTLPLIVPNQRHMGTQTELEENSHNIVATYELIYNATFMVEQGMGYAVTLDGLVDTHGGRKLAFRPLDTSIQMEWFLVTKKYQNFSPAARLFLSEVKRSMRDWTAERE